MKKQNWEGEFFDELAKELEELFPKGECQERGKAIVLNAQANIIFRRLLPEIRKELLEAVREIMLKKPIEEIITWWKKQLTDEQRIQLMGGESWKGDISERHAQLRLMFLFAYLQEMIGEAEK